MTVKLYIGANNQTGEVETGLVESVLNKYFDGYTVENSVGYWLGKRENSVVVTLVTSGPELKTVLNELKNVLHQDAIAWQTVAKLNFA